MNKFVIFSAVILWFTYMWSPVEAQTDRCAQFSTNKTCLNDGNCGCAYLICDGKSSCTATNETTGVPLNPGTCRDMHWWSNCTRSFQTPTSETNGPSTTQIVLLIFGCIIFVGAIVGVTLWIRARRRTAYTSV